VNPRAAAALGTAPLIGPAEIRARYNVTAVGAGAVAQAVAEFQGQYYRPSDLKQFFGKYLPNNPNFTVAKVVGTNNADSPGVEASLDIQYIMGVAPNEVNYFYATAEFDFWDGLSKWATAVSGDADAPLVHSLSYGDQGADQPGHAYKDRMTKAFQQMGARGLSIIFASGDSGSGCDFCVYLQPSFPATSPAVTSVGATRFLAGTTGAEAAVEAFHSGGGFSWYFNRAKQAKWQDDAVSAYLKAAGDAGVLPSNFRYDAAGRGTPDVSALGIGYAVIVGGSVRSVGGTSASAPTFAALVSLLNEQRKAAGTAPLGFLNPRIYQTFAANATAFYDVTEGNGDDGCCWTGFPAFKGWDGVTGVGTPNYAALSELWAK